MGSALDIKTASELELAMLINGYEGLAWRINHDAADGRIKEEGVDDSLTELRGEVETIVNEIKERTGIAEHAELKKYVQEKVKEQETLWDNQWAELYNEGSVFKGTEEHSPVFETIRTYFPRSGCMGPGQHIFARVRDSTQFVELDNRSIVSLKKLNGKKSIYTNLSPEERGLIKAHEYPGKRTGDRAEERSEWNAFDPWGHVTFYHSGFEDTFEVMDKFNAPNVNPCKDNEILLARSHSKPIFAEFTPRELDLMTISSEPAKYKLGYRYRLGDKGDKTLPLSL